MRAGPNTETARMVGRLLGLYGLVGVIAGAAAVGFVQLVDLGMDAMFQTIAAPAHFDLTLPTGRRWLVLVIPVTGGLASGLLCAFLAPEAMGTGIGHIIDAYHNRGGRIRARVPVVKAVAGALTLGSGGSGGVEGPIAQIAAGIGAFLADRFKLRPRERRVLMMAGCAAGIGAVFHAPMAAAIFAAEVLYAEMDIEHEVLVPAIIASTAAYGVFGVSHGWAPIFGFPEVRFGHPIELLPYLVLAVVLAAGAIGFVSLHRTVQRRLGRHPRIPVWLRPATGALLVGAVGLFVPSALGVGYRIVETAVNGHTPVTILLLLALAKAVTSTLTAGTGGASGLFAPSLVVGGALGGAVGGAAATLFPDMGLEPAAFVVVGMGGFFGAVVNAPLSTVIMVAEVVGSYRLIVPALWVTTIAWLLSRRWHLFQVQAATRLDAPAQLADMMGGILSRIRVSEALPTLEAPRHVPPTLGLRPLVALFASSGQGVFPIVNHGRIEGVVDGRQLRRAIGEQGVDGLLIANDFQIPAVTVRRDETLLDAITKMSASGYDELVVVDDTDPNRMLGLLSRRAVVTVYHRRMLERAPDTSDAVDSSPVHLVDAIRGGAILSAVSGDSVAAVLEAMIREATARQTPASGAGASHSPAAQGGPSDDADPATLVRLLMAREALGGTGVGQGIALPHPHTDDLSGIETPRVIIGVLSRPIDWGAFDGRPVDIVCILLCPSGDAHLRLLGQAARVLGGAQVPRLLRQRASEKMIMAAVQEALADAEAT